MDKKSLNHVAELISFECLPKAKKGESLEEYVKRAYPKFEEFILKSENPVISQIEGDLKNPVRNAAARVSLRHRLVENWCKVNDPFELEPPKDATTDEILAHNGVESDSEALKKAMGADAFEAYIKGLKTPKKDGLSAKEVAEKRDAHFGQYEPVMPSKKEYTHGTGGETRDYHFDGSLQVQFLNDHENFLNALNLEDTFPENEADESEKASDEQE